MPLDNDKLSRDSGVEIEDDEEKEALVAPERQEERKEQAQPTLTITNTANYVPPPVRPQRSELRKSNFAMIAKQEQEAQENIKHKRMSGSQKAAWTMSMSSWAAILDKEFNLDELDPTKKYKEQQRLAQEEQRQKQKDLERQQKEDEEQEQEQQQDTGLAIPSFSKTRKRTSSLIGLVSSASSTFSMSSTLHSSSRLSIRKSTATLVPPQTLPKLSNTQSIRRKPISILLTPTEENMVSRRSSSLINLADAKSIHDIPSTPTSPSPSIQPATFSSIPRPLISRNNSSSHGKLYLHVNGIQDILLPLPKERAYVRCVVSDGRFEYMSRYEILSQSIVFDYECVIDTHPDMIITISLHVRPDYVMKSRLPFSRLFSSKKKKKECLSGYVNKEDGAIGQARFALAHMLPVCSETSYMAGFHCFNAWYSRSFRERHRQKKRSQVDPDQDVLKVVGNFDVEMLYLPTFDSAQVRISF
ncbi:hypothetical protein EDC96DRAFT_526923 [Choanephora cucurbitarum]|nr:hypothetical protein EDC96DRAFT_526923 [Choanephora cucurbitarum]